MDRAADDLVLRLIVLRRGWVTQAAWRDALAERARARKPLQEVLVRAGFLPEAEAEALSSPERRKEYLKRMVDAEQAFWKHPPQRIGKYPVEGLAARGGRAVVFRAVREHRPVAIKVLAHAHAFDLEEVERFRRQGEFGLLLDHPHLIKVHDFGWDRSIPFLVMQWVEGAPLSHSLEEGRGLPLERLVDVVIQSARGMAHAHERRILHKDLKPDNILVDRVGHAVVTDFGVAQMFGEDDPERSIVGTPAYMSPEQAKGARIDLRADLFSLGATLYECLTRHQPYQGAHRRAVIEEAASGKFHPPRHFNPDVPRELEAITLRAMARRPAERFRSMGELEAALVAWVGGGPPASPHPKGWLDRILGR